MLRIKRDQLSTALTTATFLGCGGQGIAIFMAKPVRPPQIRLAHALGAR